MRLSIVFASLEASAIYNNDYVVGCNLEVWV